VYTINFAGKVMVEGINACRLLGGRDRIEDIRNSGGGGGGADVCLSNWNLKEKEIRHIYAEHSPAISKTVLHGSKVKASL
jgi:hypothetical protein